MAYDDNFYRVYARFLEEPIVRQSHDWVFAIAKQNPCFQNVVDLGCGKSHEFEVFVQPENYFGMDLIAGGDFTTKVDYRRIDYREWSSVWKFTATAFVSLFSSEPDGPREHNYALYQRIFDQLPDVKVGLVSGFYYADCKTESVIEETGDIRSYQTLESPEDVKSPYILERRIVMHVPSKMFGDQVYEVWKFLYRK